MIKLEQFKEQFIAHIKWGWEGEYADYLLGLANDPQKCTKVYNLTKLVAHRNNISEGDARHHLITHNKLQNI